MKVITTKTKVYKFKELPEEAKQKAIDDQIHAWIEVIPYEEATGNFKRAINKAENMRTPWFISSYVYDYCLNELIDEIELNDYDFTIDGKIF